MTELVDSVTVDSSLADVIRSNTGKGILRKILVRGYKDYVAVFTLITKYHIVGEEAAALRKVAVQVLPPRKISRRLNLNGLLTGEQNAD